MEKIKSLCIKYKDILLYGFFGVCTTLVNIISYYILYNILGIPNVVSTAAAWVIGVIFAFVTNKIWVFDSKSWDKKTVVHEAVSFFSARLLTGLLDLLIMYLAVDIFAQNSLVWKIISNVIVIVLNYIASKLIIFKHRD